MSLLLSFYGDDFTGSTDVMEALALHGIKTVLFTRRPSEHELKSFDGFQAIGLAGTSRSQTPQWMDENLPAVFGWLQSLGARFCHYKVCSTFDSSPAIGSIGRAIDIARSVFNQACVPLVVGAPQLRRFTFAGHLFAGFQGQVYRIDRHPVMSRHPVTPMDESDLRLHLSRQTDLPARLFEAGNVAPGIALVDVHDAHTQLQAGETLLNLDLAALPFVAGSSGVEYALMKAMKAQKLLPEHVSFAPLSAVKQTMVVSGSVSPTTERQIRFALANGFTGIAADVRRLSGLDNEGEVTHLKALAFEILSRGGSPLVYSALGPASDDSAGIDEFPDGRMRLSRALGSILAAAIKHFKLARVITAGGDTSSHALGELDVLALTTRYPLVQSPGSPLCRIHSASRSFDGVEIAMKGGQVGADDYFTSLRDGSV